MLLAQQAPRLLAAFKQGGGIENFPNVANALNNGYDPGLIESNLEMDPNGEFHVGGYLPNLDYLYDTSIPQSDLGIAPSLSDLDFSNFSPEDTSAVAGQMLEENLNMGDGYQPAETSALAMLEQNPNIGLSPEEPSEDPYIIDGMEVSDEDMDELHQSEMWDNGYNYKRGKLTDWYRRHKR